MAIIRTTVIVPTLDSPTLDGTLLALGSEIGQRADVEVIVAGLDRAGLRAAWPNARYAPTEEPVFPGAARNHGARIALGDVLIFLDADCHPAPGWLGALELCLAAEPCAVSGGVAFEPEGYWRRVDNVALFHEFLAVLPRGRRRFLPSLTFGIRRDIFERVGGFDPGLRSAEDLDLTARLTRGGVPLYFEPAAVVVHRPAGRASAGAVWRRHLIYGANSALVRRRYLDVFAAPAILGSPTLMLVLAVPIAIVTTLGIFLREPATRRYIAHAPGVCLAKLGWCMSVARRRADVASVA
jgi:hypothetical protein